MQSCNQKSYSDHPEVEGFASSTYTQPLGHCNYLQSVAESENSMQSPGIKQPRGWCPSFNLLRLISYNLTCPEPAHNEDHSSNSVYFP